MKLGLNPLRMHHDYISRIIGYGDERSEAPELNVLNFLYLDHDNRHLQLWSAARTGAQSMYIFVF